MRKFSTAAGARRYPSLRGLGTTPPSKLPPPSLPEGVGSVAQIDPTAAADKVGWFAVHTCIDGRGCRDAALAWSLFLAGLPFYYPQAERIRIEAGTGRRHRQSASLFEGYLFAAGEVAQKHCRDNRDLAECILREPRRGQIAGELRIIEAALKADPRLDVRRIDRAGVNVRVTRGPWINEEGIVEAIKEKPETVRVWVLIKMMQRSVPIEVDVSDLEVI